MVDPSRRGKAIPVLIGLVTVALRLRGRYFPGETPALAPIPPERPGGGRRARRRRRVRSGHANA
jgi:hypothetical protein